MEEVPSKGYRAYNSFVSRGYTGLCITGFNPEVLKAKWDVKEPIVWVAKGEEAGAQAIGPDRLPKISLTIAEFLKTKEKDKRIIIMDCVEYLIRNNEFKDIMKFLHQINDYVCISNVILIMPLYLSGLDAKHKGFLEREFKVLEEDLYVSQLLDPELTPKN